MERQAPEFTDLDYGLDRVAIVNQLHDLTGRLLILERRQNAELEQRATTRRRERIAAKTLTR